MSHSFLLNCHTDVDRCVRLVKLLRQYSRGSGVAVYYDGPGGGAGAEAARRLDQLGVGVTRHPWQPDKCRSILAGLSFMIGNNNGSEVASYLHSDMIPTDWPTFWHFVRRFTNSGKLMTWCRMWPQHVGVSFCALHFRLPAAKSLFPWSVPGDLEEESRRAGEWFNELQFARHLDRVNPVWRALTYKVGMIVKPYNGEIEFHDKTFAHKLWHTADYSFRVHDYTPEASVIHTDDEVFWDHYEEIVRV